MSEMKQLNVDFLKKERYVINEDENLVLEIDTTDFNIIKRLEEAYPKIDVALQKYENFQQHESDGENEVDELKEVNDYLTSINDEIGNILDFIFDANVYEVFGSKANLMSIKDGEFIFELIISTLFDLYTNSITEQYNKLQKRISKHTSKYIK